MTTTSNKSITASRANKHGCTLQNHKVYGETVTKIHFPDGSGVSGNFAPDQTTIANVMQALLNEVLVEEAFGSVLVEKCADENSAPS
jgi:hypothetical protein